MATHRLQVSLDLDLTGDSKPEVHVTPIDLPISDSLAALIQKEIEEADKTDKIPGDHVLEEGTTIKVPVHAVFTTVNVALKGTAILKIVEKP